MAEYYPLLLRAVANLRDAPVEKRRAIYDRARNALLEQLRSMQPAVPEEAIVRESTALDEAIERIEAEVAGDRGPRPANAAAATPRPDDVVVLPPPVEPEPPRPAPPPPAASPVADPVAVPHPGPAVTPAVSAPAVTVGEPIAAAAASTLLRARSPVAPPPVAPPRPTGPRPAAEALQRLITEQGEATPAVIRADRSGEEDSRLRAAASTRAAAALPTAPKLQVTSFAEAMIDAGAQTGESGADLSPSSDRGVVDEAVRPAAPRPVTRERFNPRVLILAVIGALVVLGIAYTAYRLRDKPEALARARAAREAAEQAEARRSSKTSNRAIAGATPPVQGAPAGVENAAPEQAPAGAGSTPPAAAPSPAPPTPATPAAVPLAQPSSGPAEAVQPAASDAAPRSSPPSIPVAQRAAFLIDSPDDLPDRVKTYVGTVVWRADSINPGQGQPLVQAVHADIDVPDVGLKLTMLMQKNLEPQFPASHTLDLRFTAANGSAAAVKQINVPQMRKDDSPTGDMLVGLPVTITENYFLVGLSRGEASPRNIDLIKTRNWFDIPLLMSSGKVAKITFEKGATGQQVVDQVIDSWQ